MKYVIPHWMEYKNPMQVFPDLLTLVCVAIFLAFMVSPVFAVDNTTGTQGTPLFTSVTTPATIQLTPSMTTVPTQQAYSSTALPTPVIKKPVIDFSITPSDGTAPLTVTFYPIFNSSGGAPDHIIWDFGDGQQLNDTLKTRYEHSYIIAGTYTVTLTSVNAGGSSVQTHENAIIIRVPESSATSTTPSPNVTQNVTTVPTTVPPTVVVNATPTITVNNTAANLTTGMSNTTTNVSPCSPDMSIANFTASPVEGPAPLHVKFIDNSTCAPVMLYDWDFGTPTNPGVKTLRDPDVTYTIPGIYNVSLKVTNSFNNNNTKTELAFIRVLPPVTPTPFPTPSPTPLPVPVVITNFTANITAGDAPLVVQFTDVSTGATPVTWSWDFGDGSNASVKNPVHTYNNTGNYTVTLKTSAGGPVSTKVREQYIVVSGGLPGIPLDILMIIAIIIVVALVIIIFLRGRGRRPCSHTSEATDESSHQGHESGGGSHPRHGRDL